MRKSRRDLSAVANLEIFSRECAELLHSFCFRFVIPETFLPKHPDREKIVTYLRHRSYQGVEALPASLAGVPLQKVREWRKIPEFRQMEEDATQHCIDIIEGRGILTAIVTGDKDQASRVLTARRSELYGQKQSITGHSGGPIEVKVELGGVPRPKRLSKDANNSR